MRRTSTSTFLRLTGLLAEEFRTDVLYDDEIRSISWVNLTILLDSFTSKTHPITIRGRPEIYTAWICVLWFFVVAKDVSHES